MPGGRSVVTSPAVPAHLLAWPRPFTSRRLITHRADVDVYGFCPVPLQNELPDLPPIGGLGEDPVAAVLEVVAVGAKGAVGEAHSAAEVGGRSACRGWPACCHATVAGAVSEACIAAAVVAIRGGRRCVLESLTHACPSFCRVP